MPKAKHPLAFLPVSLGLVVLLLSLFLAVIKVSDSGPSSSFNSGARADAVGATLAISPSSGEFNFKQGSSYPGGILLAGRDQDIKRADVRVKFDPLAVRVDPDVTPGTLFDNNALLEVDNNRGVIFISAENFDPRPVAGILASFSYEPVKTGPVEFVIEYKGAGHLGDSNVISAQDRDVLSAVESARFLFR